jgi:drug/metabolite transporter (DMT)-like permease
MVAVIFALVAFFGWGVGDVFNAIATRKIGSFNASFYGYFAGLIFATFYIPFAIGSLKEVTFSVIILTSVLTICELIGFFFYNEGLKTGTAPLIGTIGGSFTALVVILSFVFLGERLIIAQVISVIVIFIGLFFSVIHVSDLKKSKAVFNRGTIYALIAMTGWAIYFTFIKIPVKEAGFFWPSYVTNIVGSAVFFITGFRRIKLPKIKLQSGFPAVIASGILLTVGGFGFNIGVGQGLSSVVAPIAGAYPALFALLSCLIFKDPITRQQKYGMVVTLVGIILLAYFSR